LVAAKFLKLANFGNSSGSCKITNGGMLQVGAMSVGLGFSGFDWNDGTIRNYDANTDLSIFSGLTLKLAETGTHTFDIDSGRTGIIYAVLKDATNNGSLKKTGDGTLALTGVNTYRGGTLIEEGLFVVTGSILNSSRITVSDSAMLELAKLGGSATAASVPIDNNGTVIISACSQKVGTITGTGITQVYAGASLTASSIVQDTLIIGKVPEPSVIIMLGMAAFGLLGWSWKRRRKGD
jgi:autotransporter-associated beta strand protein